MNYDDMPAGPEMDQWVGIKCTDFESVYIRNGKCRCIRRLINNAHDDEECWSPSTNIAHAWEVIEKITNPSFAHRDAVGIPASTRFAYWWPSSNLWAESASGAALAICRAALLAMGNKCP